MGSDTRFADLRRLADWFATEPSRPSLHVEKIVERLGAVCVPLLGRELCAPQQARRDAARTALAQLATTQRSVRPRVIEALREITDGAAPDHGKVCALGLLGELGERGAARFHDPDKIQRTSAINLAAQLETAADIASAADLMVGKLAPDDMVSLLAIMAEAVPARAHDLVHELCARLDLAADLRERIADVALLHAPTTPVSIEPRRIARPTLVTVLVDGAARVVVVATRKVSGERRWRRWAVLISGDGRIEDCLHEEHTGGDRDAATLIANLCADGYRVASREPLHAKELVAAAARVTGALAARSADHAAQRLPSAYYLGRDLLDLGEAHLARARANPTSATVGRAVELIADGDLPRARLLLARCEPSADVEAATAACDLAQDRAADAAACLARAIELEPAWPLHHWNLAAALHRLNDRAGSYQALKRFVAASAEPTALVGDPDQPERLVLANKLLVELARTARLAGVSLRKRKRKQ
jgi:tetratricopeptide (TPR) repeat protein